MALNKKKLSKKTLLQIILVTLAIIIIFFTYFYKDRDTQLVKKLDKNIIKKESGVQDNLSTFENITYEGLDANQNNFVIDSDYAEFTGDKPNIILLKIILCRFFFKDGTILKITSDKGVYNNITNDIEFEEEVKMYYLENRLFSDKASFVNSENYLLVENNVIGEGPEGNLVADRVNVDLIEKKMKVSMYNQDKVNIKVNY